MKIGLGRLIPIANMCCFASPDQYGSHLEHLFSFFTVTDTFRLHKERCFIDRTWNYCHRLWLEIWIGGTAHPLLYISFTYVQS